MSEIKLKPCPFCGGEASINTPVRINAESLIVVECNDCGASPYGVCFGTKEGETGETEKKRIIAEAWNRRVENA